VVEEAGISKPTFHEFLTENLGMHRVAAKYKGWNFNSGNYLFTTDTK